MRNLILEVQYKNPNWWNTIGVTKWIWPMDKETDEGLRSNTINGIMLYYTDPKPRTLHTVARIRELTMHETSCLELGIESGAKYELHRADLHDWEVDWLTMEKEPLHSIGIRYFDSKIETIFQVQNNTEVEHISRYL